MCVLTNLYPNVSIDTCSARKLNLGCAVAVNGVLVESTHPSQRVELQVSEIDLLGECDPTVCNK